MHSRQVFWPNYCSTYNVDLNFNKHFRTRLVVHLLARIKGTPYDGDEHQFNDQDHNSIIIDQNRLYIHKTIHFRSTTYDTRRIEESGKPHKMDVMVLSHEDKLDSHPAFPYWHARIIAIYHIMVRQRTEGGLSPPSQMDFLFIHWFGFDSPDGQSSWHAQQMHKVGFLPDSDVHGPAFGFLDPREVIRTVHMIPDFASIKTKDLLTGESMAIPEPDLDGEYPTYYVAMYMPKLFSYITLFYPGFPIVIFSCGTKEGGLGIQQHGSATRFYLQMNIHYSQMSMHFQRWMSPLGIRAMRVARTQTWMMMRWTILGQT